MKLSLLLAALLVLPAAADDDDAEKLFRHVEDLFLKAKSIDLAFDIAIDGVFQGKLDGALLAKTGNKSRLELTGDFAFGTDAKKPFKMRMISDGVKTMMTASAPDAPPQISDTLKDLDRMQSLFMARSGIAAPIFVMAENVQPGQKPKDFNPAEQLRVAAFRLGPNEKLGQTPARVLHYQLSNRNFKNPFAVTLWLDAKTNFPLKRLIAVNEKGRAMTLTETYSKLTLNPDLADKNFELPKE